MNKTLKELNNMFKKQSLPYKATIGNKAIKYWKLYPGEEDAGYQVSPKVALSELKL